MRFAEARTLLKCTFLIHCGSSKLLNDVTDFESDILPIGHKFSAEIKRCGRLFIGWARW